VKVRFRHVHSENFAVPLLIDNKERFVERSGLGWKRKTFAGSAPRQTPRRDWHSRADPANEISLFAQRYWRKISVGAVPLGFATTITAK
jgi:hypothetical protein